MPRKQTGKSSKTVRAKQKASLTQKHEKLARNLIAALIVLLVTIGGAYAVIHSHAQSDFRTINIQVGPQVNKDYPAGATFDVPVTGSQSFQGSTGQAVVMLSFDRNDVEYQGYTCGSVTPCRSDTTFNGEQPPAYHHVYAYLCFDVPFSNGQPTANLFTIHLKALKHLPGPYEVDWFVLWSGYAPSSCDSNRDASNVAWSNGQGYCGDRYTGACDTGSEVGFGPYQQSTTGSGDGNTSAKNSMTGAGGGKSSSSSASASKQSTTNTSVPTTTTQGESTKQPTIEPSPFYDGKQYSSGSDADSVFGDLTVAHRTVRYGWLIILTVVIVGATAGLAVWRYRHKRR